MQTLKAAREFFAARGGSDSAQNDQLLLEMKTFASWDITDDGLAHLEVLPRLEELNLASNTLVTGAGFAHVNRMERLRTLVLSGTRVTDAGIATLAHPRLEELFLPNRITAAGLRRIEQNLPRLRRLYYPCPGDMEALGIVAGLSNLELLDLSESRNLSAAALARVGALQELRILYLNDAGITDADLKEIQNPALEELSLGRAYIQGPGLAALAGLKRLRTLNLLGTRIDDQAIAHLEKLPLLENLNISRTGVGDEGMRTIARLPNLRRLVMTHLRVSNRGIAALTTAPCLEDINLSFTETDGAAVWSFTRLPRLKRLRVTGTGIGPVALRWLRWRRPGIIVRE